MKRLQEEEKDIEILSDIELVPELWPRIFNWLELLDKSFKNSEKWVSLTLICKTFYRAVYQMEKIFIRINNIKDNPLYDISKSLLQFSCLKRLTLAYSVGPLVIGCLPNLEKLKFIFIPYRTSYLPNLSFLVQRYLPKLVSLSIENSTIDTYVLKGLEKEIRYRITTLKLGSQKWEMDNLIGLFPSLSLLKMTTGGEGLIIEDYPQLKEIYCLSTHNVGKFTGRCRIYRKVYRWKLLPELFYRGIPKNYYFGMGQMKDGQQVNQWKFYDRKKNFIQSIECVSSQ